MINIVLVEPEIPANTGNISRTCAILDAKLHLVKPLAFDISEKAVKRAGLDYWDKLNLEVHESLNDYLNKYPVNENTYLITTKGKKNYADITYYSNGNYTDDIFILFGKETKGLPEDLILSNVNNAIRIPMKKDCRSLNLSNSAAIVAYEIARQANFYNLEKESNYFG